MDAIATNTATDANKAAPSGQPVSAQLRGETIGYAVQSIGYNLAGNLIEPYISYRIQQHYSGRHPSAHGGGNYSQNVAGEFIGDFAGGAALIAAETCIPTQLHDFTRKARGWLDPFYDKIARNFLVHDCTDKEYEQKVNSWKVFQERNMVRSGLIATVGIAANVATQKWLLSNPSPTGVILGGKLASTAVTMALGLGARFAFPKQMNSMDQWMGKVITPMIEEKEADSQNKPAVSHVEKLAKKEKSTQLEVTSR